MSDIPLPYDPTIPQLYVLLANRARISQPLRDQYTVDADPMAPPELGVVCRLEFLPQGDPAIIPFSKYIEAGLITVLSDNETPAGRRSTGKTPEQIQSDASYAAFQAEVARLDAEKAAQRRAALAKRQEAERQQLERQLGGRINIGAKSAN